MSDLWNTDGSLTGGAVNILPVSCMPFGVEYVVRACNCLPDKQDIWTAQDVEQSILQGSEYLLLVHQDDVLGACAVRVYADGSADLFNFALYPQYRGKGYGHRALELILAYIRGKQAARVYIRVNRGNIPAHKLYTEHGFA